MYKETHDENYVIGTYPNNIQTTSELSSVPGHKIDQNTTQ